MRKIDYRLYYYFATAIFSLVFAVVGFSYNAWRLEETESNNNIRTASFELLTNLAQLEQIVYAAHYDKDEIAGNPRKGWVKVGLIEDLSALISAQVETRAIELKETWGTNWSEMNDSREATDQIVSSIETIRNEIKKVLRNLR